MEEFLYKVSVIVPVYNVERYLEACLDSLVMQNIDKDDIEVLLIDDGSDDSSLNICQLYSKMFPFFKVIHKENGGVASARNLGIKCASGKYLMYLDSDDMLTPDTISKVTTFFDDVYDDVDLVTYKIVPYKNGKAQAMHYRYQYLEKSGIYDLEESPYIVQTTMNIVVKNLKNIYFDTSLEQGEDQKYITENLLAKLKIGFCEDGEYKYMKRDESAVSMQAYSLYLYEQRMKLFEDLFERYDEVPKYVQSMLLANYSWEITSDCVIPYHYKGKKFEEAIAKIKNLISKVEIDTILQFPKIDNFHKYYLISMKNDISPTILADEKKISLQVGTKELYKTEKIEIVINKIRVENHKLYLLGFIKSPLFNFMDGMPGLYAVENGKRRNITVFRSINSCYKTKMETNCFWGFSYECDVKKILHFFFQVDLDGFTYETYYYLMPVSVFNKGIGVNSYVRDNTLITMEGNVFSLRQLNENEIYNIEAGRKFPDNVNIAVYLLRNKSIHYPNRGNVWLYCDSGAVKKDNAYYQFVNDFSKNDGKERWYIYDRDLADIIDLFTEEQRKYLLPYGSEQHRMLYLCAEYILCSFSDIRPRFPFKGDAEFSYYRDLFKAQTIYLQHGVLHADLRFTQSAERCKVDKIVISSYFEKANYMDNYHYREEDLIPVGMERYDYIDKSRNAKNRILFAPSWRSYLLGRGADAKWSGNTARIVESDYYKKFMDFLNSDELYKILKENDLYLDAKLHQNMISTMGLFGVAKDRISLVEEVRVEDYKLFITDISSFVFDYAYLQRAIFYFMPDMVQFESGMNHYRKLDFPFESAFGRLVETPEEAVREIERIIKNNFVPDAEYAERMAEFYLPMENCCENLYEYLIDSNRGK